MSLTLHVDESLSCKTTMMSRIPYLAKKGRSHDSSGTSSEERGVYQVSLFSVLMKLLTGTWNCSVPRVPHHPSLPPPLHDSSISLQEQDKCDGSKMNSLSASCRIPAASSSPFAPPRAVTEPRALSWLSKRSLYQFVPIKNGKNLWII